MRTVFVDTFYWVSFTNPKDPLHQQTVEIERSMQGVRLVTTEVVLIELLNYFCSYGSLMRQKTAMIVHRILKNPTIEVVPHSAELFSAGLELYENRLDKGYSLTDCISMQVMRSRGITEVLTQDRHFVQE
ncbi:MAG: type II toxin-antitoxin system VapC family toxin [Hormoscilla sp. GM102CHS1]|nr:type II toxin-antitoxin system VapC family toxin [Hormoscilla sp. GM102CHS1]